MNLSCGIIGLPNVGKSTLFNALLKKQSAFAEASAGQASSGVARVGNYPFCTIEPNVGIVPVPDDRLLKLAEIVADEDPSTSLRSAQDDKKNLPPIKPATVEFYDIAGLVKGASEGAGLGNKFLSHIREVTVIAHVVRAFEDADIVREGSISPEEDYQTIQLELIYADLQTLQKVVSNRKNDAVKLQAASKLMKAMNQGTRAYDVPLTDEERESVKDLFLLSNKPEIIVLNVEEDDYTPEKMEAIKEKYKNLLSPVIANGSEAISKGIATSPASRVPRNDEDDNFVVICAKIEAELAALSDEEQKEYLADLGLEKSGLERLIQKAYQELGLISFLTAGTKEVRAWTIKRYMDAQHAAGEIHTDFIKKFIKAEVISFEDYVSVGGRKKAREAGKAMLQGRDYIVRDGDVIEFKIGS